MSKVLEMNNSDKKKKFEDAKSRMKERQEANAHWAEVFRAKYVKGYYDHLGFYNQNSHDLIGSYKEKDGCTLYIREGERVIESNMITVCNNAGYPVSYFKGECLMYSFGKEWIIGRYLDSVMDVMRLYGAMGYRVYLMTVYYDNADVDYSRKLDWLKGIIEGGLYGKRANVKDIHQLKIKEYTISSHRLYIWVLSDDGTLEETESVLLNRVKGSVEAVKALLGYLLQSALLSKADIQSLMDMKRGSRVKRYVRDIAKVPYEYKDRYGTTAYAQQLIREGRDPRLKAIKVKRKGKVV